MEGVVGFHLCSALNETGTQHTRLYSQSIASGKVVAAISPPFSLCLSFASYSKAFPVATMSKLIRGICKLNVSPSFKQTKD